MNLFTLDREIYIMRFYAVMNNFKTVIGGPGRDLAPLRNEIDRDQSSTSTSVLTAMSQRFER